VGKWLGTSSQPPAAGKQTEQGTEKEWRKGTGGCYLSPTHSSSCQVQFLEPILCSHHLWCPSMSHLGISEPEQKAGFTYTCLKFPQRSKVRQKTRRAAGLVMTEVIQIHHFSHYLPVQSASTFRPCLLQTRSSLHPAELEMVLHSLCGTWLE